MRTGFLLAMLTLLLASAAQGQVTRCVDPKTGKTTYTDGLCSSGESGRIVVEQQSRDAIEAQRAQAAAARRRTNEADQRALETLQAMNQSPRPTAATSLGGSGEPSMNSAACKRAQHDLAVVQNIRTTKRSAEPEARAMRIACGLPEPMSATGSQSMPMQMPAAPPAVITSCDATGCWDSAGGRYNKGAGNTYFGPRGACTASGGTMVCP